VTDRRAGKAVPSFNVFGSGRDSCTSPAEVSILFELLSGFPPPSLLFSGDEPASAGFLWSDPRSEPFSGSDRPSWVSGIDIGSKCGMSLRTRASSTGVWSGVGGKAGYGLCAGVHGRFLTGVCGGSGSSTVKDLRKGHSVFSNCKILPSTSRKSWARCASSLQATGTSILQYCGLRICKMNLLESSSTHHTWLFGKIGCRTEPQLRKATDPGARYILNWPVYGRG